MRNSRGNNSEMLTDERLRLKLLKEDYKARKKVYADISSLFKRLDKFAKQEFERESSKRFNIDEDKKDYLQEYIRLVNRYINEFELLKEFDYKCHKSDSILMHVELLEYLNTYRCRLEHLGATLIRLGYREQVKEVWKSIKKIEELSRFMSKLLYR